jgi:predicted aconitase with swiveling domain
MSAGSLGVDGIVTGAALRVVAGPEGATVDDGSVTRTARTLVEGEASAEALVLDEPLSFWGGLDPEDGTIIDAHHPQHGATVTGRVLVMPSGRGSSSASSVIAEALRVGTGPAAIVLGETDPIIVVGVLVAEELHGAGCPVVTLTGGRRPDPRGR